MSFGGGRGSSDDADTSPSPPPFGAGSPSTPLPLVAWRRPGRQLPSSRRAQLSGSEASGLLVPRTVRRREAGLGAEKAAEEAGGRANTKRSRVGSRADVDMVARRRRRIASDPGPKPVPAVLSCRRGFLRPPRLYLAAPSAAPRLRVPSPRRQAPPSLPARSSTRLPSRGSLSEVKSAFCPYPRPIQGRFRGRLLSSQNLGILDLRHLREKAEVTQHHRLPRKTRVQLEGYQGGEGVEPLRRIPHFPRVAEWRTAANIIEGRKLSRWNNIVVPYEHSPRGR